MRIGVDATCWNNRRGYGRHLRSLLAALAEVDQRHEYKLFIDGPLVEQGDLPKNAAAVLVQTSVPAAEAARADGSRSLSDMWAVSRALSSSAVDCLFFPTVYSYVPVFSQATKLLMIHDVIAERLPQHVFPTLAGRTRWRLKVALARWQADWILTVSEFSRRALVEHFGLKPDKVKVIGEAPHPIFRQLPDATIPAELIQKGVQPDSRLLTYVGGFGPHKNLLRLLDAFEAIASEPDFVDVLLMLVGDYESDPFYSCYPELRQKLAGSRIEPRVVFTGFLPDSDLVQLLNCSSMLVLPSLMEGFGLPAVEAAACGIPAVVTRESPLGELLAGGALTIDPQKTEDLQQAIGSLLSDDSLRRKMGREALQAARRLSWEQAAKQWLSLLEEVGEGAAASHE